MSLDIHFTAVIKRVLEIQLEAPIERSWRPESSNLGDLLGDNDRANLEAIM